MVHYAGSYYKKHNDFILKNNFWITKCIRPHPYQIGPNENTRKSAVMKGLNIVSQIKNWSFIIFQDYSLK